RARGGQVTAPSSGRTDCAGNRSLHLPVLRPAVRGSPLRGFPCQVCSLCTPREVRYQRGRTPHSARLHCGAGVSSRFFHDHAHAVLIGIVLTLPLLFWEGESIPCNNDIEAWLPQNSPIRASYEDFKQEFGGEEFVMIALEGRAIDDPLVEALAARLEHTPHIRQCLTPARFAALVRQQSVPEQQIAERIRGLTVSWDGRMIGVVALLSEQGLADRAATVQSVRDQLDYCQFRDDEVLLAGVPVVVTE